MSYEGILALFGLSQLQIEMLLVGGVIVTVVGYFALVYWHFVLAGFFLCGIVIIFQHHPTPKVEEVAIKTPTSTEEITNTKDENFQKALMIDPIWLFANLMRLKESNQTPPVETVATPVVEDAKPKQIVETEQMREYIKHCTELTRNPTLCRDNWIAVNEVGSEIILEPVERKMRKQIAQAKVEKVTPKVDDIFSKPSEVKLLDVDNVEYKERRAEALKKPNAVVAQYTFR
jgi:hypothetical protein